MTARRSLRCDVRAAAKLPARPFTPATPGALSVCRVKVRHIAGAALASGGGVAIGIAITGLSRLGNCGYPGVPVCPPNTGTYFYLMGGGLLLTVIGAVMTLGAGVMFALLAAGVTGAAERDWAAAGGCVILLLVVGAIGFPLVKQVRSTRLGASQAEAAAREFKASASRAAGLVVALADAGWTIGNDPVARITISYTPADGTAATTETTMQVPRLAVPRPGDPVTVWYDPASGKAIAELTSPEPQNLP